MIQPHAHENQIHSVPARRNLLFPRFGHRPAKSLRTRDEAEALKLINARNEVHRQPVLNLHLARGYLTAGIRKVFVENPKEFDPRKYMDPARKMVKDLVRHKVKNVLCSAGHAFD